MLMRGFWPWYWENNTTGIWKCTLAEDWNREIFASVLILPGPFYSLMLWGNFKTGWIQCEVWKTWGKNNIEYRILLATV